MSELEKSQTPSLRLIIKLCPFNLFGLTIDTPDADDVSELERTERLFT